MTTTIKIVSGAPEVELPGIGIVETNVPVTITDEQEVAFKLLTGTTLAAAGFATSSPVGIVSKPPVQPVQSTTNDDDNLGGEE